MKKAAEFPVSSLITRLRFFKFRKAKLPLIVLLFFIIIFLIGILLLYFAAVRSIPVIQDGISVIELIL